MGVSLHSRENSLCYYRLFFANENNVDTVFASLARGLVSGKLASHIYPSVDEHGNRKLITGTIKVSTADHALPDMASRGKEDTTDAKRWIICVYFQNCWDKAHAKEVRFTKYLRKLGVCALIPLARTLIGSSCNLGGCWPGAQRMQ